jgi:hypothetical protein
MFACKSRSHLCLVVWTLTPFLLSSDHVLITPTRFYIHLVRFIQNISMHAARSTTHTVKIAVIATLTGVLARTAGPTVGLPETRRDCRDSLVTLTARAAIMVMACEGTEQ